MEKKTILALLAVAVLGAGAVYVLRTPEKGERVGPPPRPIAVLKASDISGIEITNEKKDQVALERTGDKWRVTKPGDWPADQQAVKTLTDGVEKLTFGDQVTDNPQKHGELGVDDKASLVLLKGTGGKELAKLRVGKAVGGFTMVRVEGKNEVWQASGIYPYLFSRDAKGWRDHLIVEYVVADAEKLTVDGGANRLALSKMEADKDAKPNDVKWKIDEAVGNAPKTSDALDQAQVNGAVQALSNLRAADFVEDKKPQETGLDHPSLSVTVVAKGTAHKLQIGATKGDDTYVKTSDGPTIYTVKKYSMERLGHPPIDFRDKTLTKIVSSDIAAIDITSGGETTLLEHAGDKWKAKAGAVDEAKVKQLAGSFETLSANSFAEERDPAKTGLAKPNGLVVVRLKDKSTVTLKVGLLKDQEYYVQKGAGPDVYLVKKFTVERFLKKQADLAPGKPATSEKGPPGKPAPGKPAPPPGKPAKKG